MPKLSSHLSETADVAFRFHYRHLARQIQTLKPEWGSNDDHRLCFGMEMKRRCGPIQCVCAYRSYQTFNSTALPGPFKSASGRFQLRNDELEGR